MDDSRVRPRYPLDDAWLVADPMTLVLDGKPPERGVVSRARQARAPGAVARKTSLRRGIGPSRRRHLRRTGPVAIRTSLIVALVVVGGVWLWFETDPFESRPSITSPAESVARVHCPHANAPANPIRTL